jgi:hypothetical protein
MPPRVKTGQVTVKLVFDVEDVSAFCERSARNGLVFSSLHPQTDIPMRTAKTLAEIISK